MPKDANQNDDVQDQNDDVTDDVQDQSDDVTDNVQDQSDDASNEDTQQDGDQGGKSQSSKPPARRSQSQDDDPNAGLKSALSKERARARDLDKQLRDLQKKHATAEERQLLEAKEQAAAEAVAATKGPLVKALAAAELKAANVQGTNISKLVRLLDLDKVEVSEDGELVGMGDQIEELKTEFPNLFAAASSAQRVPNANAGSGNGRTKDRQDQQPPKGFAQLLADQVTGAAPLGQGMAGR